MGVDSVMFMTIGVGEVGGAGVTVVPGFSDAVVAQMLRRASSPGFERWWSRVQNAGYCARPIHLSGVDGLGRERQVLGRCKNRRASVCPWHCHVAASSTT